MINFLFRSKAPIRTQEQQIQVKLKAENILLYYKNTCPFCLIVKSKIKKLAINIELKNIIKNEQAYNELVKGGGKPTVPCLKIEGKEKTTWLYESSDITAYLEAEFSTTKK